MAAIAASASVHAREGAISAPKIRAEQKARVNSIRQHSPVPGRRARRYPTQVMP